MIAAASLALWMHYRTMMPRTWWAAPMQGLGNLACLKKSPCSFSYVIKSGRPKEGDIVMLLPNKGPCRMLYEPPTYRDGLCWIWDRNVYCEIPCEGIKP